MDSFFLEKADRKTYLLGNHEKEGKASTFFPFCDRIIVKEDRTDWQPEDYQNLP